MRPGTCHAGGVPHVDDRLLNADARLHQKRRRDAASYREHVLDAIVREAAVWDLVVLALPESIHVDKTLRGRVDVDIPVALRNGIIETCSREIVRLRERVGSLDAP